MIELQTCYRQLGVSRQARTLARQIQFNYPSILHSVCEQNLTIAQPGVDRRRSTCDAELVRRASGISFNQTLVKRYQTVNNTGYLLLVNIEPSYSVLNSHLNRWCTEHWRPANDHHGGCTEV
jgi:hypothetical protein